MTKRIDRSDISLYTYPSISAFQNKAEAWGIEAISNTWPSLPESHKLTEGQRELLEAFGNKWAIMGWWLVYFRTRAADVRKHPYNLQEFKAGRSYAWVLNKRLELFAGVFELKPKMAQHYATPLNGWLLHINELKQEQNRVILSEVPSLTKRDQIVKAKQDFKRLSEDSVPFTKLPGNLHHYRLLRAATDLIRPPVTEEGKKFRSEYWKPYLNALKDWIEDLSGENYVGVRVTEGGLEERNKGRPRKEPKK